jgi:hypothetical protein
LEVNQKTGTTEPEDRNNWWILRIAYKIFVHKPKGKRPLGGDKTCGRVLLKLTVLTVV